MTEIRSGIPRKARTGFCQISSAEHRWPRQLEAGGGVQEPELPDDPQPDTAVPVVADGPVIGESDLTPWFFGHGCGLTGPHPARTPAALRGFTFGPLTAARPVHNVKPAGHKQRVGGPLEHPPRIRHPAATEPQRGLRSGQ